MNIIKQSARKSVSFLSLALLVTIPGCKCPDWLSWLPMCKGEQGIVTNNSSSMEEQKTQNNNNNNNNNTGNWVAPDDRSQVLQYINGQPFVTQQEVDELIENNDELKALSKMASPAQVTYVTMQARASTKLMQAAVEKKGINKNPQYIKEQNAMMDSARAMLNHRFLTQELPVSVTDADVREFYEANKDNIPQLILARGGVKAACLPFDTMEDAQAFVQKVEQNSGDFKKTVDEAGLTSKFKDFMLVNNQSFAYDPVLRGHILNMQNVPATEVCKVSDQSYWVVNATEKQESKYQPFAMVKDQIKQYLESQKRTQEFDKELAKLMEEFKVTKSKAGQAIAAEFEQGYPAGMPEGLMEAEELMAE
jgi:hypothetical protein